MMALTDNGFLCVGRSMMVSIIRKYPCLVVLLALGGAGGLAAEARNRSVPPTASGESSERSDEQQVRGLLTRQAEAWNAGNLEAFMETYWKSPDLTFSSGGQTTRGWQATLDRYRSRYCSAEKMGQLRFDNFEYYPLADSAALVLGTWHLVNSEGNPHGNFSLVLRKIEGQWRIVHDHSSRFQPTDEDPGDSDRPR